MSVQSYVIQSYRTTVLVMCVYHWYQMVVLALQYQLQSKDRAQIVDADPRRQINLTLELQESNSYTCHKTSFYAHRNLEIHVHNLKVW